MPNVITVTALNQYVHTLLENDSVLTDIAICGEMSNFKKHFKTGHCYFSLKDEKSSVKAVMFRSDADRLAFRPEDGIRVVARCRVSLYERDGAFQLYVEDLFPDGVGAVQLAFEQLKQKLGSEGLFAPEHKKMLPKYPARVGLVTSKTGAALQDILKVSARRCPCAEFILAPVTVQGLAAAGEIASAIHTLDASGLVDVIIVTRGGGSAEDLWVFNAEAIARASFVCDTPIISAIGHETDVTILDFVADHRAPTPSAAAEMALPDLWQAQDTMCIICKNIADNIRNQMESCYNRLDVMQSHPFVQGMRLLPAEKHRQIVFLAQSLYREMERTRKVSEMRLRAGAATAAGLNPYNILAKGYGVARSEGRVLASVRQASGGQKFDLILKDGALGCRVETVTVLAGDATNFR